MGTREFDLGDVLTVTTGNLLSPRGIRGAYEVCSFLAGEPVYSHQIGRVLDEAAPVVLRQHPQLAGITSEGVNDKASLETWLAGMKARFGETLPLTPMTADEHERIDPESELAEKVHPDRLMIVNGKAPI